MRTAQAQAQNRSVQEGACEKCEHRSWQPAQAGKWLRDEGCRQGRLFLCPHLAVQWCGVTAGLKQLHNTVGNGQCHTIGMQTVSQAACSLGSARNYRQRRQTARGICMRSRVAYLLLSATNATSAKQRRCSSACNMRPGGRCWQAQAHRYFNSHLILPWRQARTARKHSAHIENVSQARYSHCRQYIYNALARHHAAAGSHSILCGRSRALQVCIAESSQKFPPALSTARSSVYRQAQIQASRCHRKVIGACGRHVCTVNAFHRISFSTAWKYHQRTVIGTHMVRRRYAAIA